MTKIKLVLALCFIANISFGQAPAIKAEIIGEGNPIIFLPGFTTPGAIWKETIAHLKSDSENHIISYAGFNGNPPIEMPWYDQIKDALILYIQENKLKNISIVGHSMGGNLAVDLAAALPKRVKKLILVDAIPCMREVMMPGVSAASLSYDNPYSNQMLAMDDDQFKNMASGMAKNMTFKKEKVAILTNWMIAADRKTYVYGYTDLLKLDLRKVLVKVKAKTLILGAPFPDVATAKATYENQYADLSDKSIAMIADSKHFIMFDQPELFYDKVNTFLTNGQ